MYTQESLIKKIENKEIDSYFKDIEEHINLSNSFNDFLNSIIVFINIENIYEHYFDKKNSLKFTNIFVTLQNKLIALSSNLNPNNRPSKEIFYLYKISSKCKIPSNEILLSNIKELTTMFDMQNDDSTQNFINEILFALEIFNGSHNALENYIKRTVTLNVNTLENNYAEFFQTLLAYLNIDINFLIKIFSDIFEGKYYFSLSPIQRRSIYNWIAHVLINITKFHNNKEWLRLYDKWIKIINNHIKRDEIDEVMYINFFVHHITGNLFSKMNEAKKYNKDVNIPVSKACKKWAEDNYLLDCKKNITDKGKIKIAFVETRLVKNSPYFVLISLLKVISSNKDFMKKYEITIYSANYLEKSPDDIYCIQEIEQLGFQVVNPNNYIFNKDGFYHSHLEKAINIRNKIIENNTDILITYNDYDIFNFLFATRTTPKQIYWSHINCYYNIEGIDKRISHFNQEDNTFNFEIFNIPIDINKYNPKVDMSEVKKIRDKFPEDSIILGSIGRLIKVDSNEYLETVAKIMEDNPKTIYLACGSGNQENIKEKVKELGILDRFYFEGHVDAHIYGHVIDLYLDTFPSHGGESVEEYRYKGKPYIVLHKEELLSSEEIKVLIESFYSNKRITIKEKSSNLFNSPLYTKEILNSLKRHQYIDKINKNAQMFYAISFAEAPKDYINIANELLKNQELRHKVVQDLIYYYNHKNFTSDFIDYL